MYSIMASYYSLLSFLVMAATLVVSQQCDLQFDGRVPSDFSAATLNTDNGVFDPNNVFGQGLDLGSVVQIQDSLSSLFDVGTIPIEVTISDDSIFAPSADNVQTGFRRAELLIASNDGTDASTTGVKTLHFSVMKDANRPLNLTHEYQLVFLESNDFSTNQFVLKTGTILGTDTADPDTLQLFGNVNANPAQILFSTPFTEDVFHNFAVTLDFDALTTQVFYSQDTDALVAQTETLANDVSGQGQFHFGVLKKGLNGGDDIVKNGEQEQGIDEGIVFGGIFEEDSSSGCISLSV
ncbi:glycoside hydrolase family 131 protein [Xylaria bambusicola]|uniref:glycoside hydrolase family 131 protein n=1 Tax=Xylaria bambusicola TaxID=326684 RepID=UPI0020073CE5|nr:glycoside hydrolase family 131 protein [Xylaria bambusicola]KAI0522168.1 glycoside hydrolase family 131 protein [Xylaria bambusicola]